MDISPTQLSAPILRAMRQGNPSKASGLDWMLLRQIAICCVLLVPLIWNQLGGRNPGVVFFLGTILGVGLSGTQFLLECIRRTGLLVAALALYAMLPFLMEDDPFGSGVTTWVLTISYGYCAGVAFSRSIARHGMHPVMHAILLTSAATTAFVFFIIQTQGVQNFIRITNQGDRSQLDEGVVLYRLFNTGNFFFWVALLTINAATGIGCLVSHISKKAKLLYVCSIVLACYCNYATATRTVIFLVGIISIILAVIAMLHPHTTWGRRLGIGVGLTSFVVVAGVILLSFYSYDVVVMRMGQTQHDSRFYFWGQALTVIWEHPFSNSADYFYAAKWAHNHVLDFALRNSIVGGLVTAFIYLWILWQGFRLTVVQPLGSGYVVVFVVLIGNTLAAMTLPPQSSLFAFVLISGVIFSLAEPTPRRFAVGPKRASC